MNFDLILGILALGIVIYVVGDAIYQYKTTPGTAIITAFYNSLTLLWTRFCVFVAAVVAFLASAATYFHLPGVADLLQKEVPANVWPFIPIGILIVTEYARRRTLGAAPPAEPPTSG